MAERPNILLIVTDQHRRDTLGCYGAPVCRTPHLDRITSTGMRFDSAFTNTAICTAVRATLLTGQEPHKHGMLANLERNIGYPTELPPRTTPFSQYLREAGYRCGVVGKWHLGEHLGPEDWGFEGIHFPGWDAPKTHPVYLAYVQANGLPPWRVTDELRGTFPNGRPSLPLAGIYQGPVEGTYPYFLAERTIAALRAYAEGAHNGQPFFLRTDFFGPHLPYYIPEPYASLYDPGLVSRLPSMDETFENKPRVQRSYAAHWAFDTYAWETWQRIVAMYWGYVTLIDEQIGRILQALDELDLQDDTVVLATADHAGFVGGHRLADKGPMMYDEIYRIPLVARWPGHTPPSSTCDAMVTLMDLTPTFLEMAGVPAPGTMDGRSIVPLLEGNTPADWPEHVYLQFHGHHFPYPQRGIRTRHHKLVINPADIHELYDLERDPHELHNVFSDLAYAEVRQSLVQQLYTHLMAAGDNFYQWMSSFFDVE